MNQLIKELRTPKATLFLYEGNLVKVLTHENQVLDVDDMRVIQEARRKLVKDNPYVIMSVTEPFAGITREAREFGFRKEVIGERLALAVVVRTLAHRIL